MVKKGSGILLVFTDIDPKDEEEFNAWYNTEQLGSLLTLPGFLDAARYAAVKGGPMYLAAYELSSVDALKTRELLDFRAHPSPWSRRISPTAIGKNVARTLGTQIFPPSPELMERALPPALQIGRMSVPESMDREWNEWYNGEYIPGYRKVPGVIHARRFRVVEGDTRYATRLRIRGREGVGDGRLERPARGIVAAFRTDAGGHDPRPRLARRLPPHLSVGRRRAFTAWPRAQPRGWASPATTWTPGRRSSAAGAMRTLDARLPLPRMT